jgi:aspartyl-tRNA(Asn)/glutamyl-tRNA(Gln) amidotransferase subunit A
MKPNPAAASNPVYPLPLPPRLGLNGATSRGYAAMDVAFMTIAELNRLYARRALSPVEVTKALLACIAGHDGRLHSFLRVTEETALQQAAEAERELRAGSHRGPLHGIPYALKDIIETAGIPTTGHSKLRQDYVPAADAELVTRLKAGGGIMLGKLATWEFALGGPSFDLPWPPARNPWNPDYLPGGSSSGAGAAVAAGFVPGAVGTDTGGSVRGPAALCGIAGIKPTYGRVSRRGVFPNTFTMDHCGPLCRSAEDIALFLQVIAGFDPDDPGSEDVPVPNYAAALHQGVRGLRLGLVEDWYRGAPHPDVAPAVDAAVELLRGLGAVVEPVRLSSLRDYTDCKTTISSVELYSIHEHDLRTRPQDFGRILRNRVLPGALIRAEEYMAALRWRSALAREQAQALRRVDAFITAAALDVADKAEPNQPDRLVSAPSITMPFSVGGLPAIAIPCGFSRAEGLPLSLQIAAAPFAEAMVLRIAHAYQQATDWHRRHPRLPSSSPALQPGGEAS